MSPSGEIGLRFERTYEALPRRHAAPARHLPRRGGRCRTLLARAEAGRLPVRRLPEALLSRARRAGEEPGRARVDDLSERSPRSGSDGASGGDPRLDLRHPGPRDLLPADPDRQSSSPRLCPRSVVPAAPTLRRLDLPVRAIPNRRLRARSRHPAGRACASPPLRRKPMFVRLRLLLALGAGLALLAPAARASCGAASCPSEIQSFNAPNVGHWSLDLSFQYIDQDRPRIGTHGAQVGEIPSEHDEVRTINRTATLNLRYALSNRFELGVTAPWISRFHEHLEEGEAESWHLNDS